MTHPGNGSQFAPLFETHRPMIRWVVRRILFRADPGSVDDVVQETFIKCRRCFKPELAGSFRYWALMCAKRNALSHLKRLATPRRLGILPEEEGAERIQLHDENADPESILLRKELRELILQAIQSLTTGQAAEIFRLRFIEDLSYIEVADALGIPRGTVMSSLHRSKPKVAAFIRERLAEADPLLTADQAA